MGVRRFGSVGGWPLVWCHGGLSSGLDAKFFDAGGRRCGADIVAIDRPGIGRSEAWGMSSITHWPHMVEHVADLLGLDDFAVAGWSAGGPYALACAAAMPHRVRAVATLAGMAPLECVRHVFELRLWADLLLIPVARLSLRAAAMLLWLGSWVPDRYLNWEIRRTAGSAGGGPDRAVGYGAVHGVSASGVPAQLWAGHGGCGRAVLGVLTGPACAGRSAIGRGNGAGRHW